MDGLTSRRRPLALMLLAALLLAGLPAALPSTPAHAQATVVADDEIVYIGDDEFIYVLDTNQIGSDPLIQWKSPEGDWNAVALGDVNNDGDMEIIAVGQINGDDDDGKLHIYDPVVKNPAPNLPRINGVAWELLYTRELDGKATMVAAGNLDPNVPGDEILFGFELNDSAKINPTDLFRISVIKGTTLNPDGRTWEYHIERKDDGNIWSYVHIGDLGDGGADEVALIDEEGGEVNIFRISGGFQRFYADSATDRPYRSVVFAQYVAGGNLEIAISRNASTLPSLFIYSYDPNRAQNEQLVPLSNERVTPYPRFLFAGDVNDSGDDEIFFLRRDQAPRLAMRNNGGDPPGRFDQDLDDDDDFRVGAAGDVDGDGMDEVIIARSNRIRIFTEVERSSSYTDYGTGTDRRNLQVGDLDASTQLRGPQFQLNADKLSETLQVDTVGPTRQYEVIVAGSTNLVQFTTNAASLPDWVEVTPASGSASATQPARLFVTMDARGLLPGTYTTSLMFDTNDTSVVNAPFNVAIELVVEPAQLVASPSWVMVPVVPAERCETADPVTQTVRIGGTSGVRFTATVLNAPTFEEALAALNGEVATAEIRDGELILGNLEGFATSVPLAALAEVAPAAVNITWPSSSPWVAISSATDTVDTTMTVTIDPKERTQDFDLAYIILVGDSRTGVPPSNVRVIPVNLLCTDSQVQLPFIQLR